MEGSRFDVCVEAVAQFLAMIDVFAKELRWRVISIMRQQQEKEIKEHQENLQWFRSS